MLLTTFIVCHLCNFYYNFIVATGFCEFANKQICYVMLCYVRNCLFKVVFAIPKLSIGIAAAVL